MFPGGRPRLPSGWRAAVRAARRSAATPECSRTSPHTLRAAESRISMPAPGSSSAWASSRNLHAAVTRLVKQLGWIGLEAARQLAEFLRRTAAVTHQPFHFRQAVAQEQAEIVAMCVHQPIQIRGGGGEVLRDAADVVGGLGQVRTG